METNVFFSAVQSALDAHIERMVDARLKEILTTNKAYEMIMSNLSDRVTALESNLQDALLTRLAALENNPAIGTDTVLAERVKALEEQTTHVPTLMSPEMIVDSMNKAEWLWEKINAYIETGIEDRIERAIDDHCSTYDHDSYDSLYGDWSDYDPASFVSEDDIESKINDVLENASFEVKVSI